MMSLSGTTPPGKYYYLALGDSYTIGQSVMAAENFPNQVVSILREDSLDLAPARIIAKKGWTTDELESGILSAGNTDPLRETYDLVSLLIGVNDQYRGSNTSAYKPRFESLLKKAIHFAGGRANHVLVLSIPDWGVTPFAEGRNRAVIAKEIDGYNAVNKKIAMQYNVQYIGITAWTREAIADPSLVAADGLHPSGKEYRRWAERIAAFFKSRL